MSDWLYSICKIVVRGIYLRNVKIIIKGKIPCKAAIIVANHDNPWDPPLIMIAAKRWVHFFTSNVLFKNPINRLFLKMIGQIPVQSGLKELNKKAFSKASVYLEKRELVGIFPYPDDLIKKRKVLYTGVTRLIKENDVPIIPINVKLCEKRRWDSFYDVNFDKVYIIIGKPIYKFRGKCKKEMPKKACLRLTQELIGRINKLTC